MEVPKNNFHVRDAIVILKKEGTIALHIKTEIELIPNSRYFNEYFFFPSSKKFTKRSTLLAFL